MRQKQLARLSAAAIPGSVKLRFLSVLSSVLVLAAPVSLPSQVGGSSFPPFDAAFRDKLEAIRLVDRDDAAEVRSYIAALQELERAGLPLEARSIVAGKFREVGSLNVPLLVRAAQERVDSWALVYGAIAELAAEEHADLMLEAFEKSPGFAGAVVALGKEKDARETLVYWLHELGGEPRGGTPPEILKGVANLKEPSTYPLLLRAFENSHSPQVVYESLKDLPASELERSLFIIWRKEQAERGGGFDLAFFTRVLAERGKPEAIRYIFKEIGTDPADEFERLFRGRLVGDLVKTALQVTNAPAEFNRYELSRWYYINQHQLRYQPAQKKWIVPGLHPMRTWTDIEGRVVQARLISATETSATIVRSDGGRFAFPLERLSQEDQDYVRGQR